MSINAAWKSIVEYDASLRKSNAQMRELFRRNKVNKREYFIKMAIASIGFVAGCTTQPAPATYPKPNETITPNKEEKLTDPEWQMLLDNGVAERFSDQLIDDIGGDPNLTDGAKGLLYAHFGAKESANTLRGMWKKVATPDFLKDSNIFAGSDMKTIMRTREVNGGFAFFDEKTSTYSKFIPADGFQGKYLRDSHTSWVDAWKTIGMPEDMTARIQIMGATKGSGVFVGGKEYIVLTTPQAGFATLDSYYNKKLLMTLDPKAAKAEVFALLERYYLDVLFPINQKGVIQRDINWRNMIMREDTRGLRLIPIDLDGAYYMIDKSMIPRWQYNQLADRAARRGVILETFDNFVKKYPDKFRGIPTSPSEIKAIQIKVNGMPVKVIIPEASVKGMKGEEMGAYVRQMATEITSQYRAVPQGGVIKFDVIDATGKITQMEIVKTTSFGDRIIGTGGKLGETINTLSKGVKIASDVLLVWWLASEIGQIINPDYKVSFQSGAAFPDSMVSYQGGDLSLWLDGAFDRIISVKRNMANLAASIVNADSPVVKGFYNLDRRILLHCMSVYGMTQQDIAKILQSKANSSLYPAPSDVQFAEPFPLLVSGAQEPINAHFSAVTDDEGNQLMVMWGGEVDKATGETNLRPYVAFHKKKGEAKWSDQLLTDNPWSLAMSLKEYNMTLQCSADAKGLIKNDNLKLFCTFEKK